MRRSLLKLGFALALICAGSISLSENPSAAPASAEARGVIPGRYVVLLDPTSDPAAEANALADEHGFEVDEVYSRAVQGFAADMSSTDAAAVADDPRVALIEPDRTVSAAVQTIPTGVDRVDTETLAAAGIGGPAGPDLNVDVAVIDSGIDTEHPDLRVAGGVSFTGPACGGVSHDDAHGHGTHVSGTLAAKDNSQGVVGVAPGARLWAVRVLDANANGFLSCVIAGVDWVTERRAEYNDGPADGDAGIRIEVANMSLGGGPSGAVCTAIANAVTEGVIVAAAAGNGRTDGSMSTPGDCPAAIGVSAYADFDGEPGGAAHPNPPLQVIGCQEDEDDSFACFSNFGSTVDIAAPGVLVYSTYRDGQYFTMSGTSMATPLVAGAAALLRLGGYDGSGAGPEVVSALGALNWALPQTSQCGFTGDVDAFPEPVLYLGTGCCGGDDDCDGYSNSREAFLGTDPNADCPATSSPNDEAPDSWPPDVDDSQRVNTADAGRFVAPLNQSSGSPLYSTRLDLDQDANIDIVDVTMLIEPLNRVCI
jgi:subtilisin